MEAKGGPSNAHYFYSDSSKGNFQTCENIRSTEINDSPFICLLLMNIVLIFCFPLRYILMASPLKATLRGS